MYIRITVIKVKFYFYIRIYFDIVHLYHSPLELVKTIKR